MGTSLNMITFWQCIVQADPSGSNISSCPLGTWSFYKHMTFLLWHNRNFYGILITREVKKVFLEISQNMRNEFPQKQRTRTTLPQYFLSFLSSVNASGNPFHIRTQYWTQYYFFAYVISDQFISKRYYNIAMGRTSLKVMENSI